MYFSSYYASFNYCKVFFYKPTYQHSPLCNCYDCSCSNLFFIICYPKNFKVMNDILIEFYKVHKLYEDLFKYEITFYLAVLALIFAFFKIQADLFTINKSTNDKDRILFNKFHKKGIEAKLKYFDIVIFSILFIISICFSVWASQIYRPNTQISNENETIISLAVVFFFILILLGVFELIFLYYLKIKTSYEIFIRRN